MLPFANTGILSCCLEEERGREGGREGGREVNNESALRNDNKCLSNIPIMCGVWVYVREGGGGGERERERDSPSLT